MARREIETVLVRLGAKDRIDQLSLDRVAEILRSLPQHDPSGRSVQKVYSMALAHYERNGQRLPADVPLFARRGKEAGYYREGEVYYSENNRLPRKIADRFALLSYLRRSGGAKVPAFFGVKNVIEIGIAVERKESLPALTMKYEAWMRERFPYLLAYRIFGLHGDQKSEAKNQMPGHLRRRRITHF